MDGLRPSLLPKDQSFEPAMSAALACWISFLEYRSNHLYGSEEVAKFNMRCETCIQSQKNIRKQGSQFPQTFPCLNISRTVLSMFIKVQERYRAYKSVHNEVET
jgi:hypothetical protein